MPTPSSTASSTTPIASISPATACDEPDQDQSQRIDPQLASRQNHPPAGRRLKRATSCRNTERHDLGTTGRHRRNQQIAFGRDGDQPIGEDQPPTFTRKVNGWFREGQWQSSTARMSRYEPPRAPDGSFRRISLKKVDRGG